MQEANPTKTRKVALLGCLDSIYGILCQSESAAANKAKDQQPSKQVCMLATVHCVHFPVCELQINNPVLESVKFLFFLTFLAPVKTSQESVLLSFCFLKEASEYSEHAETQNHE